MYSTKILGEPMSVHSGHCTSKRNCPEQCLVPRRVYFVENESEHVTLCLSQHPTVLSSPLHNCPLSILKTRPLCRLAGRQDSLPDMEVDWGLSCLSLHHMPPQPASNRHMTSWANSPLGQLRSLYDCSGQSMQTRLFRQFCPLLQFPWLSFTSEPQSVLRGP